MHPGLGAFYVWRQNGLPTQFPLLVARLLKNRYAACVSDQSSHAPGMLAVGLSANRVANFTSR